MACPGGVRCKRLCAVQGLYCLPNGVPCCIHKGAPDVFKYLWKLMASIWEKEQFRECGIWMFGTEQHDLASNSDSKDRRQGPPCGIFRSPKCLWIGATKSAVEVIQLL